MAHAFADYGEGDAFGFGGGCPAVTCDVHGEGYRYADFLGYGLKVVVDAVAYVAVGVAFVCAGSPDDREKESGRIFGIFVENLLHMRTDI